MGKPLTEIVDSQEGVAKERVAFMDDRIGILVTNKQSGNSGFITKTKEGFSNAVMEEIYLEVKWYT